MRRLLSVCVVTLVALGAGLWVCLQAPMLDKVRAGIVSPVLSQMLGHDVTIEGHLRVRPGRSLTVSVSDLTIPNPGWADHDSMLSVGQGAFTVPLCALFGCKHVIENIRLRDVAASFERSTAGEPSWTRDDDEAADAAAPFPREVLAGLVHGDNLKLTLLNHETGWRFVGNVADWRATPQPDGGDWRISSSGTINDVPFQLSGEVERDADLHTSLLEFSLADVRARLSSTSTEWDFSDVIEGELTVDVPSVQALVDVLDLRYTTEASASFRVALAGAFDALSSPSLAMRLSTPDGVAVDVRGEVGDVWAMADSRLEFTAQLPLLPGKPAAATNIYELGVTSLVATVSGRPDDFVVDDFVLETNWRGLEFQRVGPISIGRLYRGEGGRLTMPDTRILIGAADDPVLAMSGRMDDVFAGYFEAQGRFGIVARSLISVPEGQDSGALGLATGRFAAERETDGFRFTELDAAIRETDLVAGTFALDQAASGPERSVFQLDFDVPDIERFAAAMGHRAAYVETLKFNAELRVKDTALEAVANILVDQTNVSAKMRVSEENERRKTVGTVGIPLLDVRDLIGVVRTGAALFADEWTERDDNEAGLEDIVPIEFFETEVEILADSIRGAEDALSNLRASVLLSDGVFRIDPVDMTYLEGRFTGGLSAELNTTDRKVEVTGVIDALNLNEMFPDDTVEIPVAGKISAAYDLTASAASRERFAQTLDGTLSAGFRDARIGTNKIEVAGIGVVAFMFSRAARQDYSDLRCGLAKLNFADGIGTVTNGVFETEFSHASLNGTVDLTKDNIDILVETRPIKSPEVWSYIPVQISGPVLAPEVRLLPGEYPKRENERTPITEDDRARARERVDACQAVIDFLAD